MLAPPTDVGGGAGRFERNVCRGSEDEEAGDWLDDYAMGTNFEIYSIPLEVISGDSSLWRMTFSRRVVSLSRVLV